MSYLSRRFAVLLLAGLVPAMLPSLHAQQNASAPAATAADQVSRQPLLPDETTRKQTLMKLRQATSAKAVAPPSSPTTVEGGQPPNNNIGRPLAVELKASTAHIVQGASYGLDATFTNNGTVPILIPVSLVTLNVQPEMGPAKSLCSFPFSPTTQTSASPVIILQPGDIYTAAFDLGAHVDRLKSGESCYAPFFWDRVRKYVDFAPGNYTFTVGGVYCEGKITSLEECTAQHIFSETTSFPVTIDQAQIALYAGLGGLLAFLVTKFRKGSGAATAELHVPPGGEGVAAVVAPHDQDRPAPAPAPQQWLLALHQVKDVLGAMLMSITITIIADRLSTTQFPVKVSIDDFWGALTVGFVSYFVGDKFLDQVLGTRTAPAVARAPHEEPPPAVIAAAAPAPAD